MKFRIIIEEDEDGIFVAECPALPGCISQGKTRTEALENIKDAAKGYLESLKKHNEPIPPSICRITGRDYSHPVFQERTVRLSPQYAHAFHYPLTGGSAK